MLRTFAKSLLVGAVQRKVGVPRTGTIPTTLLTTGASLMLVRGKRPIGVAMAAAGAFLLWREVERDRALRPAADLVPQPLSPPLLLQPAGDASAATRPR